jgi:DNA polymerase elongation subunit (family B)
MLDCDSKNISINQSLPSAIAVTSYARIEMMELKILLAKLGIKLYYTDTDSFFVVKELPAYLIGKELGQLKDELAGG